VLVYTGTFVMELRRMGFRIFDMIIVGASRRSIPEFVLSADTAADRTMDKWREDVYTWCKVHVGRVIRYTW
jgi:hypothetical protein